MKPNPARIFVSASFLAFLFLLVPFFSYAASSGYVVINEVSWMGTVASSSDEWIEFYNNTDSPVDIADWSIYGADTGVCLNFSDADGSVTTTIPANGYLIYANHANDVKDDSSVDVVDIWDATVGMNNSSPGQLVLYDALNCGGNVVDTVNQVAGNWFAGKASPDYISMERVDPEASGSAKLNWDDNDGEIVNGKDADGNPIVGTPKAQNSVYGKSEDEEEPKEDLEMNFTLPATVTAGEGFDVPMTVKNADPSSEYYTKAVIGESTESASLRKGYTYNSVLNKWLAWNGAWDEMPTFATDADGGASFTLKSKVKDDTSSGTYYFLVRLRKVGTDDNLDSNAQTFSVNAASVTSDPSDPSLQVTFSVEDDDLKVNQSFDVKVNIKNAKGRHDYYVKIRLGLEESQLSKGRTYNSFFDSWLADNASWSKFPVVYTASDGTESITVSAKVAAGNPAGTYTMSVRIRDKETEKNYDSESQILDFGEEDPEVVADPPLAEGAVLGAITELPATGGGLFDFGVTSLLVKFWIPVLVWMLLIFIGSSTTGASVSENRTVDFAAHKLVHLFEYSVLFILIQRAVKKSFSSILRLPSSILAFLLTIGYAITDEIHQFFVPGRDARLTDILIDAGAALLGWFAVRRRKLATVVLIFILTGVAPVRAANYPSLAVPDGYELKEGEIDHLSSTIEVFNTRGVAINFRPDFDFDLSGFATFVYSYEKHYGDLDPSVFSLSIYEGLMEHCDLDSPILSMAKPLTKTVVEGIAGEAPNYQLFFGFEPLEVKSGKDYTAILTTTETSIGRYRFWLRSQYHDGFARTFNPVTKKFSDPSVASVAAPFGLFVLEGWRGTPPRFHPVVLVHGMGGKPTDWQLPEQDYVALVREMYATDEDFDYPSSWIHLYHYGNDKQGVYNYQGDIREIALGLEAVVDDLASRYAESFGETLEGLEERDEDRVVDVFGYSMGGLVARQYLIKHQDNHHIRKLITVATPHEGIYWLGRKESIGTISKVGPDLEEAISGVWDEGMKFWDKSGQPISLESVSALQMVPGSEFLGFLNLVEWTPLDVRYYTIYGDIDINLKEKVFFFTLEKKVALGDIFIFSESAVAIPAVEPAEFGYNEEWTFPVGVAVSPDGVSAKFYLEGLDIRKFRFWHLNILRQPEIKEKTVGILTGEI